MEPLHHSCIKLTHLSPNYALQEYLRAKPIHGVYGGLSVPFRNRDFPYPWKMAWSCLIQILSGTEFLDEILTQSVDDVVQKRRGPHISGTFIRSTKYKYIYKYRKHVDVT